MGRRKSAPARGVRIRKYESGREVIQLTFSLQNRQYREVLNISPTAANVKFAENMLASIKLEIAKGTYDHGHFFPDSKHSQESEIKAKTIGELVADRLAYLEKKRVYEPSTLADRKKKFKNHIQPNFGPMHVTELKPSHITDWIKRCSLGRSAVGTVLSIMNPILDAAVADEIINRNPTKLISYADLFPKRSRSKKKDQNIDPLSMDEIAAVLEHSRTEKNIFQFALFSGVRRQELPLIKWENIDWRKEQVLLDAAIGVDGHHEYLKETKTDEKRIIDLLPPAMDAIKAQREKTQLKSEYVFINPRTGEYYGLKSLYWFWKETIRRAKTRYRPIKQTRHSFASMMLSRGENPMWVARQLGHADLNMLRDHYGKWIDESEEKGYTPKNDWNCTDNAPVEGREEKNA